MSEKTVEKKEKKSVSLFGKKIVRYPSKRSINFIHDEQAEINRRAIVLFVIFLLLLGPFVKFGVIGLLDKASQAEAQYNNVQDQISKYQEILKDYPEVKEKYDDTVGSFMTDEEKACTSRPEVIAMIDEDISANVGVRSISIVTNTVTVESDTTTLANVSKIVNILQADTRNSYVTVTTTSAKDEKRSDAVIADFVITYQGKGTPVSSAPAQEGSAS